MSLESELKNLRSLKADGNFKQNLRKRILNEYPTSYVTQPKVIFQSGLFSKFIRLRDRTLELIINLIRFNSALSLSFVILLFITIGSYASFSILPENIKTTVSESFKGINKPKVGFEVVSNIEGAKVYVNDKFMGTTPLTLDVREGEYAIRVEKDGYISYESNVVLNEAKPENKLSIELPKATDASKWTKYENKENSLSFFYPQAWNLIEKKLEDQRKISQIIIENGNTSLSISLDNEDNTLINSNKDKIYVGEIKIQDKVYKRFLVFNQYDEFTLGGIWIEESKNGKVQISYNFDDLPQDQLLASEQLKLLDQIAISFLSSQSESYVHNPESFKALDNMPWLAQGEDKVISPDVIGENPTPSPTKEDEPKEEIPVEEKISSSYINKVYGYKVDLPQKWFVSSNRAEYPLYDRGHLIEKDSKSYKVARLKIYSDKEGIVYLFMTNNPQIDINDGGNLCNLPEGERIAIEVDEDTKLIGSKNPSKYNFQLCNKNAQGFTAENIISTEKNGNIRYTIYWDATETEAKSLKEEFKAVINNIEFSDRYVEVPIHKVEYSFKEEGIQFNYKYAWNIKREDINCVEPTPQITPTPTIEGLISPTSEEIKPTCKKIGVYDNEILVAEFITGKPKETLIPANNELLKSSYLKNIEYNEVYKLMQCVDDEGCSEKEDFTYGIGYKNLGYTNLTIKYYRNTQEVYTLLKSIRFT